MVALQLRQLSVPPGQRVLLHDLSWQDFEAILEELGEHRAARLAYSQGTLEIRMPLPEHEKINVIIGDLVKILLTELDMNYEPFGSSTFKREDMNEGLEPDDCFYIQNYAAMIGKNRVDLTIDPPPDLAIEVDITSKTQLSIYESLRVPELWRYQNGKLRIDLFQGGKYIESPTSAIFPDFPITELISRFVEMSQTTGTSSAMREFRKFVREYLQEQSTSEKL